METVVLCLVAVLFICCTHWFFTRKNQKSNVVLPPGTMGLPFIGETLQLFQPSYTLDLHPFIRNKMQKYGPIFKTRVLGQPIVVSTDPEFNNYIVQQEGRAVELWLGPISKFFIPEGDDETQILGNASIHKYTRSITLNHIGVESIKERLLPQLECLIRENLHKWTSQASVDVKQAASVMTLRFFGRHLFGYDAEKLPENSRISEELFVKFADVLMTFPLNIPGTTYHKCLKEAKKAISTIKDILEERRNSQENHRGDFLDQAINDLKTQNILTEDTLVYYLLGIWFAVFSTISTMVTLIIKFLSENPSIIEELAAEHEEILKSRNKSSFSLTWDEYKSMNFTQQVINEALRFSVLIPGLLRTVLKNIQVKAVTPALHFNSEIYKDPLTFNPWRWKDLDNHTVSKNFKPFGGGSRQCPGAELSRAFLSTFLHVLVTKYRWTTIKEGQVVRNPMLGFGDGIHIKIWEKDSK